MNYINKSCLYLLFLGGGLSTQAQITNTGQLSIAPQTVVTASDNFTNSALGSLSNDGRFYLKHNLINHGGFTFNNANGAEGILYLNGNSVQHISGAGMIEVLRLQLQNASGIELAAALSVVKSADFTSGIINNRDFGGELSFESNITLTNVGNQSYVDGTLLKTGSDDFDFPIGANGYVRNVKISGITDAATLLTTQYIPQNSNATYAHDQKEATILFIDNTEYWELNSLPANATLGITLSWNMATSPSEIWSSPEELHIVQWHVAQNKWVDLGGDVDANNQTVTAIIPVLGDGVFTLATIADLQDSDDDGVPDIVENNDAPPTDPNDATDFTDSDGDGVPDYVEENSAPPTDPNDATDVTDSDGDGVPDYVEENSAPPTDPNDPTDFTDSDGDGIPDYTEERNDLSDILIENDLVSKSVASGFFKITNIEEFPNNTIEIFNRNGIKVFNIDGYDNQSNVFRGVSNSKRTLNKKGGLPTGVYFYTIQYSNEETSKTKSGYLYINE